MAQGGAAPSLNSCIIKSLQTGQMSPDLPAALLTPAKNKARHRSENKYWDYKEDLRLTDAHKIAEFVKDVAAFHNTEGGLIIVGITNEYVAQGVSGSIILDTKQIRDKIRKYVGDEIGVFQESFEIGESRLIWLIFLTKNLGIPQAILSNGPQNRNGRPLFVKGDYLYRDSDEAKRCTDDGDMERIFRGFHNEHLSAYNYEIDEPFFRLLNPNYEQFVGRRQKIDEVKESLNLRHPVIALDGLGGVGKTAIAIQAVREVYDERKYLFIVSLSAKSKVWSGHVDARRAAFAGLGGLFSEIGAVFPDIPQTNDAENLKKSLVLFMKDVGGLILIDNLEEIDDPGVLNFLCREVPEPVKVLITSRIVKNLGALTISVPAMTSSEAENLLNLELDRLGCQISNDDEEDLRAILAEAGGVPLAIKWAAQIASERRSLRVTSSILRGSGAGKQELLSFYFATMYDALRGRPKMN